MKKLKFNFHLGKGNLGKGKSLMPKVKELIVDSQEKLDFLNGQYVKIKFTHGSKILSHAYSIASAIPEIGEAILSIKIMDSRKTNSTLKTLEKNRQVAIVNLMTDPSCLDLEISVL